MVPNDRSASVKDWQRDLEDVTVEIDPTIKTLAERLRPLGLLAILILVGVELVAVLRFGASGGSAVALLVGMLGGAALGLSLRSTLAKSVAARFGIASGTVIGLSPSTEDAVLGYWSSDGQLYELWPDGRRERVGFEVVTLIAKSDRHAPRHARTQRSGLAQAQVAVFAD